MPDPFDPRNVSLGYASESSFGVQPSGSGVIQKVPFQSWSLKQPTDTVISQTIRGRRAPIDLLRTSLRAEATLGYELIHTAYDDLFSQALMSSNWAAPVTLTSSTLSFDASDDSINDSAGSLAQFTANQWVYITGFTGNASQNGFYKILTVSASKVTLTPGINSDDASGEAVTINQGAYLEDGNVFRSRTWECQFDESTDLFQVANGMSVSEWTLNVAVGEIMGGNFTMLGTAVSTQTGSSPVDPAPVAAPDNTPMSAVGHVVATRELAAMSDVEILGMTLTANNNLAVREIVGTLGAAKRHRADLFELSGTLRMFLTGNTHMDYFYDFTTHNVATIVQDDAGNTYVFDVPSLKFSDADIPIQGGQDNILEMPWNAFEDATEGIAFRIARWLSLS
jgi:hypothetical protein